MNEPYGAAAPGNSPVKNDLGKLDVIASSVSDYFVERLGFVRVGRRIIRNKSSADGDKGDGMFDGRGAGEARVEENGLGEGQINPAEIIRMVAGCSLQLGWLPVACFMTHARWIALPLETLLPFLAFLLACAVTLGLSYRLARLVEGHPRWIQTLQCLLLAVGSVLAFLGDGSGALRLPLFALAFALLGAGFSFGMALWERSVAGVGRKRMALLATAMATMFAVGFALVAHVCVAMAAVVGLMCSAVSVALWRDRPAPKADAGLKQSKLLELETKRVLLRYWSAFFLLGAGSGVMLGMFVSGLSTPPELQVTNYTLLGAALFVAGLAAGWFRKRELDFWLTFALLMLVAVATFFPINPGTKFNQHLSLILGEAWIIVLLGDAFLIAHEVDGFSARVGKNSVGLGLFGLFAGFSVGAMAVDAILKLLWHSGIIETLYDRTVFVTTCGAIMMVVAYVCTNMLINKNVLRSVELLSKGRFVTSLSLAARAEREEGSLHDGGGAIPGLDLAARCRDIALERGLTPREFEVLTVLAHGNSLARVQSDLVISEGTAITHRRNIYRKLDVHSKQELLDFVLNGDSPVQDERCCQQQ